MYFYHSYPKPIPRMWCHQWEKEEMLTHCVYRSVLTCDCAAGAAGTVVVTKKTATDAGGVLAAGAEALLMNQVAHPNIVQLLGVCPPEGERLDTWIVMEAATCDASKAVQDPNGKHSTAAEVLMMPLDVSTALVHLHTRMRCAHMDLKPGNILLVGDRNHRVAKIADFGVSLSLRANDALNVAGYTPRYAPPEQLEGTLRSRGVRLRRLRAGGRFIRGPHGPRSTELRRWGPPGRHANPHGGGDPPVARGGRNRPRAGRWPSVLSASPLMLAHVHPLKQWPYTDCGSHKARQRLTPSRCLPRGTMAPSLETGTFAKFGSP